MIRKKDIVTEEKIKLENKIECCDRAEIDLEEKARCCDYIVKHNVINLDGLRAKDIIVFKNNYEVTIDYNTLTYDIVQKKDYNLFNVCIVEALGQPITRIPFDSEEKAIKCFNRLSKKVIKKYDCFKLQPIK